MIERGQLLGPTGFGEGYEVKTVFAAFVASNIRKLGEDAASNFASIAFDADGDFFGQTNAVCVDINLNDLGIFGPVIDAVTWQGRERVQTSAQREDNVRLSDDLHRGLRPVVAQWTHRQIMRTWEAVVVLVVRAHRCIQTLCQFDQIANRARENNACTRQDHREFCLGKKTRCLSHGLFTTCGTFELNDLRQFYVDHLSPHITRNVDLCRSRRTTRF